MKTHHYPSPVTNEGCGHLTLCTESRALVVERERWESATELVFDAATCALYLVLVGSKCPARAAHTANFSTAGASGPLPGSAR